MTVGEAARYLQLHRDGVRWLANEHHLPFRRTVGGQYLFRLGDVKALGLERAASRMTPAQRQARVRRPAGQLGLPLTVVAHAARKPRSWQLATFRPRMLRLVPPGEASTQRSPSEPRAKARRSPHVA